MRWVIGCLLLILCCCSAESAVQFQDVETTCQQHCALQNETENGAANDLWCDSSCRLANCGHGCVLWRQAIHSNCSFVCNASEANVRGMSLYCLLGCNFAVSSYVQEVKDLVKLIPPPKIVTSSISHSSLTLTWDEPLGLNLPANLTYLLQKKYASEDLDGNWLNIDTTNDSKWTVTDLKPYTKYQFRLAAIVVRQGDAVFSQATEPVTTAARGAPSSAPSSVRIIVIDSNKVSVAWDPPLFANGPLVSYSLRIQSGEHIALKEILARKNPRFFIFTHLKPNTTYTVSIRARNEVDEGPPYLEAIQTPSSVEETKDGREDSVLFMAKKHHVFKQIPQIVFTPELYYSTNRTVTDMAVHLQGDAYVYVVEDREVVHELSRPAPHKVLVKTEILSSEQLENLKIAALSIDWLFIRFYVLLEDPEKKLWHIVKCRRHGKDLTFIVKNLREKPVHFEVDPYNGFLFWTQHGPNGGLYRTDLADFPVSGDSPSLHAYRVLPHRSLGVFVIDHPNFRMLVVDNNSRKILAVSLSGSLLLDFRNNTIQEEFIQVSAIVYHDDLFHCATKQRAFREEFNVNDIKYHFNYYQIPSLGRDEEYVALKIAHPNLQPVPAPTSPVQNLQAIFGYDSAIIEWQPPISYAAKGAWRNWFYRIDIENLDKGIASQPIRTNMTQYTVTGLKENSTYVVHVTACSESRCSSPANPPFVGKTLQSKNLLPVIIWAADGGIWKSSPSGDNLTLLMPTHRFQEFINESWHVTSMTWMDDYLFVVTNKSRLFVINLQTREIALISSHDVVCIAADYLGKKLYFSSLSRQTIGRFQHNDTQTEWLPIVTLAEQILVESIKGKLFWSTGYSIEGSALHGADKEIFWKTQFFSGKQAVGLTIHSELNSIFWIVRSFNGATLHRANIYDSQTAKVIGQLDHSTARGPLHYMSDRLLWLQENDTIVISDIDGRNVSLLRSQTARRLSQFIVVQNTQKISERYRLDDSINFVNVIPASVRNETLQISGSTAESFNITWEPVTNVNYGNVYYEILVKANRHHTTAVTGNTWYSVPQDWKLLPHTPISVTLRSYTTWGTAPAIHAILYSPSAIPSAPTKARVFLSCSRSSIDKDLEYIAEFRWQGPAQPNGVILGYKITCWTANSTRSLCNNVTVPANVTEYVKSGLNSNSTYYFAVAAFSAAGTGPLTKPVLLNTSQGLPLPQLLIFTIDSLQLADMDRIETSTIRNISLNSRVSAPPVAVSYLSFDKQLFWIDEMREMFSMDTVLKKRSKVLHLEGSGKSLSIDWVARNLYWSEDSDTSSSSAVYSVSLDREDDKQIKSFIVAQQRPVRIVTVDPFQSRLIWMTLNPNGSGNLKTSKLDGSDTKPFFRQQNSECTCKSNPDIGSITAVDRSDPWKPRLFWASAFRGDIWSSDWNGCNCVLEIDASQFGRAGLPPSSLAVDHHYIYWANSTSGTFYSVRRIAHTSSGEESDKLAAFTSLATAGSVIKGIRNIATIGDHLQPYPDIHCLVIAATNYSAKLINVTDTSVTLSLPVPNRPEYCKSITSPVTKYSIYYGPVKNGTNRCTSSLSHCKHVVSYESSVTLHDLDPYVRYSVRIQLSNHYTKLNYTIPIGPAILFSSKAGAPSKPRDVLAVPSSPSAIRITWLPPLSFHGPKISYEVHWSSQEFIGGIRQDYKMVVGQDHGINEPIKTVDVEGLLPGRNYNIWVRALSEEGSFTDSDHFPVKTYEDPENIILLDTTATSIKLQWRTLTHNISSFEMQKSLFGDSSWIPVDSGLNLVPGKLYDVNIDNLKPKQKYSFRMILRYRPFNATYTWPSDSRFTFETNGDVPDKPTEPQVKTIRRNVYQILWDPPTSNGYPIRYYTVQTRKSDDSWFTVAENITLNHWNVEGLEGRTNYSFRVSAWNEMGWGPSSDSSSWIYLEEYTEMAVMDTYMDIVLGISISALAAFCLVMALFSCHVCRKRQKASKESGDLHQRPGSNVEMSSLPRADLVNLRELPRTDNFIQQNNALYGVTDGDFNAELACLPHIRREEITLTKFLGSGAFGEVFEGHASNLPGFEQQMTRVAIKTLRKGATEQEKTEFLKEAQLMSHFKHEHILRLLGVCLDTDPNFLLLELMEGGDLLSFLRNNRPTLQTPSNLTLQDLVSMCVDVAKGCCYLEELHFVHRDLAARNCLVSNADRRLRVVKIGDFGLARDIYRNDYYRKEGEGLLPVRWMAPESLVDGVFTSQSDVWSFGVLLWEIMTLGQQPYPARTNLQVLHFVRAGGRLDRPPNCPDTLHNLMQKCWSYQPEDRPSFSHCLQELESLKESLNQESLHYVGNPISNGWDNQAYYRDENYNSDSGSVTTTDRESMPFLQAYANGNVLQEVLKNRPRLIRCSSERNANGRVSVARSASFAETPTLSYGVRGRYLELLSESTSIDGYEVPNPPLAPPQSEC